MGNALIGSKRKKTVKIMKIDGTTFRFRPPIQAQSILRDHPGYDLLDSDEVKQLSLRAQPLHPDALLRPGKLYFLIELPRPPPPDQRGAPPRRAWSGALHVGARDRLESLKLSRRSVSDLAVLKTSGLEEKEGGVRVRVRLPKAEVARLVEESRDPSEAAEKIMDLCLKREAAAVAAAPVVRSKELKVQKRTRFMPMPEEIIA